MRIDGKDWGFDTHSADNVQVEPPIRGIDIESLHAAVRWLASIKHTSWNEVDVGREI